MQRVIISASLLILITISTAQDTPSDVVSSFFSAMTASDTSSLRAMLDRDAVLQSAAMGRVSMSTGDDLIRGVAALPGGSLDERIYNLETLIDGALASVTMDYVLYINGTFSHCGVNVFTLALIDETWRIIHITDSRHPQPCVPNPRDSISDLLDRWHLAASDADAEVYFGLMTDDAVYIGTDASEVWSKAEFYAFAKPYFDRGKAWSFVATDRNVYLQGEEVAYFDESLSTWMGPCRGSGLLVRAGDQWRIRHYVLSMTIPNEDVDAVIEVLRGD